MSNTNEKTIKKPSKKPVKKFKVKLVPKKKKKIEQDSSTSKPTGPRIPRFRCFLDYEQIRSLLNRMLQTFPDNLEMEILGHSKEGRPIFLMLITRYIEGPRQNAIFIEAGSNGEDLISVASALYIINYLCAHASSSTTLRIMDVFVLPCSNPDAYELNLYGHKNTMNLARSFPFRLVHCNVDEIGIEKYLEASHKWKENLKVQNDEKLVLIKGIADYQTSIKLFISLQEEGEKIVYPFGTKQEPYDANSLSYVAKIGKTGSEIDFKIGSIYQQCGLTFGTIIDFLRLFSKFLKYTYIIHFNDKRKGQVFRRVPYLAENVLCVVTLMAREVDNYYRTQEYYPCCGLDKKEEQFKKNRALIR